MNRRLLLPVLFSGLCVALGFAPRAGTAAGSMDVRACRSASPLLLTSGLPEVHGKAVHGTLWGLLFARPPLHAGVVNKIVWRVTGSGTLHIRAIGPDGRTVVPSWGPERHDGSSWHRPGNEWGTGFTFPAPGCWRVHVVRGRLTGNVYFDIAPAVPASPPTPVPVVRLA